MPWNPETFTPEQRRAAASALTQARISVYQLNRAEFGPSSAGIAARAYSRVDDLLAMIYDDLHGLDGSGAQIPQPPSAS